MHAKKIKFAWLIYLLYLSTFSFYLVVFYLKTTSNNPVIKAATHQR
jgi:hypothetical protein